MIKAVIFDMDGVIIDSEPIQSKSLEILAREYNKTPIYNKEGLIHTVGISGDAGYIEFMKKHNIEESLEVLRKKRRIIFVNLLKQKLQPTPGFLKLLRKLSKQNLKIALASNRFLEHVSLILGNLGVKGKFDVIIGPSSTIQHKPHPDIYLETARRLEILPEDCAVIEDSETGIISAKKAGMKVIAVPNKYTKHHDFSKADKIVKSLSEVTVKLINNL